MNQTSAAADISEAAAWYGKLVVARRLRAAAAARRVRSPRSTRWLSTAMRDGREQLGERWLDVYLTAPVLRFAWAPGVIDRAGGSAC